MPPLPVKNLSKIRKKGKNQGTEGKIGEKRKNQKKKKKKKSKNWEGSFTLPLLTDRASYTTVKTHVNDGESILKSPGYWYMSTGQYWTIFECELPVL